MIAAANKHFVDLEQDVTDNWKAILLLGLASLILILTLSICFVRNLWSSHNSLRRKVKEARARPANLHIDIEREMNHCADSS